MASDKVDTETQRTAPANPIPILARSQRRRRPSNLDEFSDSTSSDESSPIEPHTPGSSTKPPGVSTASPSSSPILSALFGHSPSNKPFPFNRTFQPAGKEGSTDEHEDNVEPLFPASPISAHARRASTSFTGLLSQQQPSSPPFPDIQRDRASGLLRRLSIGGMFVRPSVESQQAPQTPNVTLSPAQDPSPQPLPAPTPRKAKCAATLGADTQEPPRAPTPMGERILKGHFDGFN